MNTACVVIDSPVRGQWAIMNPPGHAALAFDFLATRDRKLPYRISDLLRHIFASLPVTATYAWSQPVFAPLDGVVVGCCDGIPDRLRINMPRDLCALLLFPPKAGSPFSAYGGNYVVLKCGEVYPLFAHFRSGSLRVKLGDSVHKGQQLAEVGNSGMSLQPHLHFQIMNSADPFPLFKNLLPFKIRVGEKQSGDEWRAFSNVLPDNGDHLRL